MTKKVLIVEDYEDARSFMKTLVESYGYQALEARNGEEAIKIAHRDQPDLILMDLEMPIIDGLATTRVIRGLDEEARVPIIAVTAYGIDDVQALEAGCDELIFKPLDVDSLEPLLSKYLIQ